MSYEQYAKIRDNFGLTDAEVSRRSGVDKSSFSHWKGGDYKPKAEKMKAIAKALGVSVEYLETGKTTDPIMTLREQMSKEELALANLAAKADPEQVKLTITFLKTLMGDK